jgi:RecB family exonuclease
MLKFFQIHTAKERDALLSKLDPQTETWLVSDLRSKFEVQNILISKQGFYEDHSVLRANELWQIIQKRFDPDFRTVGNDFLKTWLRERLSNCEFQAAKNKGEETVLSMLDSTMQIISNPNGPEMMEDWLSENPVAKERWGEWFKLTVNYGQELLESKKISKSWIASWLTNQSGWTGLWKQNLIVDLGADLTRSEAEVLHELSRFVDVTIVEPLTVDRNKYSFLLKPYEDIQGRAEIQKPVEGFSSQNTANIQTLRFTGPLAEVKQVTGTIRGWIDAGVAPRQIVVSATNIEDYWSVLQYYFAEEGIPAAKDLTYRLHSIPAVVKWLSRMKVALRNFEFQDLELAFFAQDDQDYRYEKFRALFKNLLDESDLNRDQRILKAFSSENLPTDSIAIDVVLGLMARFWVSESLEQLEEIMRSLLEVVDPDLRLKFSNWVYWIEQICAHSESAILPANRLGVQIVNLQSADSSELTHRIFLGLTESAFKQKKQKMISASEVEKIFADIGFQIPHPEELSLNFELSWVLQSGHSENGSETHLYFPMTNQEGSIEAPHPVWMNFTNGLDVPVTVPADVVADQQQSLAELNAVGSLKAWSEERIKAIHSQVQNDLGENPLFAPMTGASVQRMSASQLETFFECSFKFAANKIFKLLDPIEVDLDPDIRSKGQLVHQLFETLAQEPRRYNWTESELRVVLEEKRKLGEIQNASFGDSNLWPSLQENLVKLGLRFLEHEKSTMDERKKTIATELKFKANFEGFEWIGSIDRLDLSQTGGVVVYDYKTRNKSYGYAQWLKKNHLQLGFYAWLLASDKIQESSEEMKNVESALYYIYKDFKKFGANQDQLQSFHQEIQSKISEFKTKYGNGEFIPVPLDKASCEYCQWSQLCRAPHLNQ